MDVEIYQLGDFKMKKLLLLVLFLITPLMFNTALAADSIKIGIIDMNRVLKDAPLMISLNEKLMKSFKSKLDSLNADKQNLQDAVDQLALKGNTMSVEEQNKLQDKIITDRANVAIADATLQRDLSIAKNQALQQFMGKLNNVITKIANDDKYDLIEQRSNMTYVNDKLDITKKVLDELK
jgi:outer membrane protein